MGRNNKTRRAAKAKARARARSRSRDGRQTPGDGSDRRGRRPPVDDEAKFSCEAQAESCLWAAAGGGPVSREQGWNARCALDTLPVSVVYDRAEILLLRLVDRMWSHGWQPSELHRQGRRVGPAPAGRLTGWAIATDHANRRSTTLDSRWVTQVESLDLPTVNGRPGWIGAWADDEGFDGPEAISPIVHALRNLFGLGPLDPLIPPPGADRSDPGSKWWSSADVAAGAETDPVLERIRALLAKAESSAFEAEATAFTAKAQELMTRHAIDAAVVAGQGRGDDDHPVSIRVPIDAPYVDAKSLLLQTVADAGRCRGVFHSDVALSTVVGFPADVAAVEMLFTSLLLQAQTAMADAAKMAPAGARTRSQSYRSAFLLAYTTRIGERLREINDAVYAEAESEQGAAFLPVLRSRFAEVDDFIDDHFGELKSSSVRGGYDAAGWAGGEWAANQARLNSGDIAGEERSRGLPVGASGA